MAQRIHDNDIIVTEDLKKPPKTIKQSSFRLALFVALFIWCFVPFFGERIIQA